MATLKVPRKPTGALAHAYESLAIAHERDRAQRARIAELEAQRGWKLGNEFLPFHPDASHVAPEYRDAWNDCYRSLLAGVTLPPFQVSAWMTPEGDRVVPETTMAAARRDGGAMLSSLQPYTVALGRIALPTERERTAVARAICAACDEHPDHRGDAQGNQYRWQDYLAAADAAIAALVMAPQSGRQS